MTESYGKIKTCECLYNSIREGNVVTLKCHGFGIAGFRYFAHDIINKDDTVRERQQYNIKSY